MRKTRILAIAPYEGLQQTLAEQASEMKDSIQMDTYTGDLEIGVEIAASLDLSNYDIILSRGGTARLLEQKFSLPVINMAPTVLDVLRFVKIARNLTERYAVVAYPDIADIASKVFTLVDRKETICVIQSPEEARQTVERLKQDGFTLVIGDAITVSTAGQMNLNAILITSGKESVQAAISEAIRLHSLLFRVQDQNRLLRRILDSAPTFIFAMDKEKRILYSNAAVSSGDQSLLLEEASGISETEENIHRTLRLGEKLWNFEERLLPDKENRAFYITVKKSYARDSRGAVEPVLGKDIVRNNSLDRIGEMKSIQEQAEKTAYRRFPVYLEGEAGTPIEDVLRTMIRANEAEKNTCWIINCEKLDDSTARRLIENDNSPLAENGSVIIFHHIHAFPEKKRKLYFEFAHVSNLHHRNIVYYTSEEDPGREWRNFLSNIPCWYLPPLRKRRSDIPSLATLYISEWNYTLGRQIIGISPEAINLLQEYDWPGNNDQLRAIIRQAVISADEDILVPADIRPAIKESESNKANASLLLKGTLEDMEMRILHTVLAEEDGNKIKAAERLGISRSTLWRMLKKEDE